MAYKIGTPMACKKAGALTGALLAQTDQGPLSRIQAVRNRRQLDCPVCLSATACIKFQSKLKKSMQQILRLLQLNLFERRDLMALLRGDPVHDKQPDAS